MGSALDNQKDQSLYHLVYSLGISAVFGAVDVLFLWPQTDLAHALETTGECDAVGVVFVRYRERARNRFLRCDLHVFEKAHARQRRSGARD